MEPEVSPVSSCPVPPLQYSELYTDERISGGQALPPPPPLDGHYMIFGEEHNSQEELLPSLESIGIKRLYNIGTGDPRGELKRLNRSLVAAFLDLVEILIRSPDAVEERKKKMEDLRLLFVNTHHLINEYRPHQARETLHLMMKVQQIERLETADKFRQHFEAVRSSLKSCLDQLPDNLELSEELKMRIASATGGSRQPERQSDTATSQETARDNFMCDFCL